MCLSVLSAFVWNRTGLVLQRLSWLIQFLSLYFLWLILLLHLLHVEVQRKTLVYGCHFSDVNWVCGWSEKIFQIHACVKSCCLGEQMVQVITDYGLCCYCWKQLWLSFLCVASLIFQVFAGGCCHFVFISDSICCIKPSALHHGGFCFSFLFGFSFIQI